MPSCRGTPSGPERGHEDELEHDEDELEHDELDDEHDELEHDEDEEHDDEPEEHDDELDAHDEPELTSLLELELQSLLEPAPAAGPK
jgi:hypothetical protein